MRIMAEYIWVDGKKPTATLRSKTKIVDVNGSCIPPKHLPNAIIDEWGYDGSSTYQAETSPSDLVLTPVRVVNDPVEGSPHILVLCEVFDINGSPHKTNTRAYLKKVYEKYKEEVPIFGIEQEFTLYRGTKPLGWPEGGFPTPQGDNYCGIGCDEVSGRNLIKAHTKACLKAEIPIYGTNAEVMPAQWEFQLNALDPLAEVDYLLLARWLLYRLGEDLNIYIQLHPKPIKGDWNGAGGHTNFSTKRMNAETAIDSIQGINAVKEACARLGSLHKEHMAVYGAFNRERLTGRHETCKYDEFRYAELDRGASVRIPLSTVKNKKGYLEDRRPAANADFYVVCAALMETVLGNRFDPYDVPTYCKECASNACMCK